MCFLSTGFSPVSAPDAASTSALRSPSAFPPTSCLSQHPRHPSHRPPQPSVLPLPGLLLPGRHPYWAGPEMAAGRTASARTWARRWSCRGASRLGTAQRRPGRSEGWKRCWGKGNSLPGTQRSRRTGNPWVWQGRSQWLCQRSPRARSQRLSLWRVGVARWGRSWFRRQACREYAGAAWALIPTAEIRVTIKVMYTFVSSKVSTFTYNTYFQVI